MDSSAGLDNSRKYDREANKVFPAKAYLERYQDLKISRMQFLKGFHSFYEKYINGTAGSKSLLEFGGGPTVYTLISAAKYIDSITFADYSDTSRDEIRLWKDEKDGRHDWSKFIEYTVVDLEGDTTEGAVERREKTMREKIKEIIPCDATRSSFFSGEYATRQYDIVHCNTVFEAVLNSREAFQRGVAKLASYVKPGGYLQLMIVIGCDWYSFPGVDCQFYVLNLTPDDGIKAIENAGLSIVETINADGDVAHSGAKSFCFFVARKNIQL